MNALHLAAAHAILAASVVFAACGPVDPQDSVADIATELDEEAAGDGCVMTQGSWMDEASWPVDALTIGGTVYSHEDLLDLLRAPTKGDVSLILGQELIAARLNLRRGASAPAAVTRAIAGADAWMDEHRDRDGRLRFGVYEGDAGHEAALSFAGLLARFNAGGSDEAPDCAAGAR